MAELDDLDCEEPYSDGDSEAEVEEFCLLLTLLSRIMFWRFVSVREIS